MHNFIAHLSLSLGQVDGILIMLCAQHMNPIITIRLSQFMSLDLDQKSKTKKVEESLSYELFQPPPPIPTIQISPSPSLFPPNLPASSP